MGCDYYIVEHLRILFHGMKNPFLIKWKYHKNLIVLPLEIQSQHISTLLYENGVKFTECDDMCEIIKIRISSLEKKWEDIVSIHLDNFIFESF